MEEQNPRTWTLTHLRWLALWRWDNEGGVSASRPTARSAGFSLGRDAWLPVHMAETSGSVLRLPGLAASASSKRQASG